MLNEKAPNPKAANIRIDKQSVKIRVSVGARLDGRKAGDCAVLFCDEDSCRGELTGRDFNRIGMG